MKHASAVFMRLPSTSVVLALALLLLTSRVRAQDGAPPGDAPPPETVHLRLESDEPVVLEHRLKGDRKGAPGTWVMACVSPCDLRLPTHAAYRIGGTNARPSKEFSLVGSQGTVTLHADRATTKGLVGGIVMTSLAPPVLAVGAVLTMIGGYYEAPETLTAGLLTMAAGVTGLAVGIPLIVSNARTRVEQDMTPAFRSPLEAKAFTKVSLLTVSF